MVDVKGDNHQSPNHNFFVSGAPNDGFLVNTLKTLFTQLKGLCQLESMRSEVMQITFNCQNSIVFNA